MDYSKAYDELVIKHGYKDVPIDGNYYERHHILPKSLGGSDSPTNMIYLSGRCHFLAHWLLLKIHNNSAMAHAFFMMSSMKRGFRITSHAYDASKKALSLLHSSKSSIRRKMASEQLKAQWSNPGFALMKSTSMRIKMQDPVERDKVSAMFKQKWLDKDYHASRTGVNSPMYGKSGVLSATARRVVTPKGEFDTATEAATAFGIPNSTMYKRCRGESNKFATTFYYKDTGPGIQVTHKNAKAVVTPLGQFKSVVEAAAAHSIPVSNLYDRCQGKVAEFINKYYYITSIA